MAKSSRASTRKSNNHRRAVNVYGPAETARAERLSARLLELAKQPKPEPSEMKIDEDEEDESKNEDSKGLDTSMDVDSAKPSKARTDRKRIDKRKQKKSGIVFSKYSDRLAAKKKKAAK
ncbi:hypothetical protein B0I35DRAFT_483496 [Stachybotrys elegans]|uniref:DUF2423 domain-containing protein n=1 Tax=Stachybotrys elegans TaxID=80388 RepID=A0A8K0WKX7_9HYPO|nr:hypothetical protein B0I35DRAFT_483496 [Stachybotrys elegans]